MRRGGSMTVKVKWFATLVKRTKSREATTEVPHSPGLTPMKIFLDEGFSETDAESVMMLVNDAQSEPDHELQDGDRVEFMVSIQGGAVNDRT
jgi:molybdopterin converting factor small subunit